MAFNYDSSDRFADAKGQPQASGGGIEMMPLNQWEYNESSVLLPPGYQLSHEPVLPQAPKTPQKKILSQGGGANSQSSNQTPKKLQFSTSEIVHESPISIISNRALLPNRKRLVGYRLMAIAV